MIGFSILYVIAFIFFYNLNIKKHIAKAKLSGGRKVYSIEFLSDEIIVTDTNDNTFDVNSVYRIFERKDAFYIYPIRRFAYIAPFANENQKKLIKSNLQKWVGISKFVDRTKF